MFQRLARTALLGTVVPDLRGVRKERQGRCVRHAGRCSPSGGSECLCRLETWRLLLHGDEAEEISDFPPKRSLSLQKSPVDGRLHSIVCDPRGCGPRAARGWKMQAAQGRGRACR